ncbi:hypothetical protein GE09DRAFT_399828 [Coniochaeta sp. 2T2.1]|nr:hypothetical protein GE09DRAFT_399828 [Coniochaeta sp. 2T2.1]
MPQMVEIPSASCRSAHRYQQPGTARAMSGCPVVSKPAASEDMRAVLMDVSQSNNSEVCLSNTSCDKNSMADGPPLVFQRLALIEKAQARGQVCAFLPATGWAFDSRCVSGVCAFSAIWKCLQAFPPHGLRYSRIDRRISRSPGQSRQDSRVLLYISLITQDIARSSY